MKEREGEKMKKKKVTESTFYNDTELIKKKKEKEAKYEKRRRMNRSLYLKVPQYSTVAGSIENGFKYV